MRFFAAHLQPQVHQESQGFGFPACAIHIRRVSCQMCQHCQNKHTTVVSASEHWFILVISCITKGYNYPKNEHHSPIV